MKQLVIFTTAAMLLLCLTASALAATLESQALISVGSGFVVLPADVAVISLAIESTARDSGAAHLENQRTIGRIGQELTAMNLPGLKFTVRQVTFWESTAIGSREKTYKASSGLDVQVSDLSLVGQVVDVATKAGASAIQSVRFDLTSLDDAAKQALQLAVADAIKKAHLISNAAGLRVVMVREVRDSNAVRVYNPSLPPSASGGEMALPPLAGPVYRGQVLVQAEVTVVFDVALDKLKEPGK